MSSIKPTYERLASIGLFDAGYNVNYSPTSKDIKYDVHMEYNRGSAKYGQNVLIISSTSAHNCICQNICNCRPFCYANRDEKAHGQNVVDFKDRQGFEFMAVSNEDIITDLLNIQSNIRTKIDYIRLNEAGDFSTDFLAKAYDLHLKMAGYESLKHIIIFSYTHNYKLYNEIEPLLNSRFVVNNSYNVEAPTQRMLSNHYIVVDAFEYTYLDSLADDIKERYDIVICNCDHKCNVLCSSCMKNDNKFIFVLKH